MKFDNLAPDAENGENCRLRHIEAQKKAIDYKKDIFCGLFMFIVTGLVLYIRYG